MLELSLPRQQETMLRLRNISDLYNRWTNYTNSLNFSFFFNLTTANNIQMNPEVWVYKTSVSGRDYPLFLH